MPQQTLMLSNGQRMPCFGLGTYEIEEKRRSIKDAVKDAIDAGYRLIDTAKIYESEGLVGDGVREKIAEGVIEREDMFIVTKLWNTDHNPKDVLPACKSSLKKLDLDYIDLYLMHWPFSYPESAKGIWPMDDKGRALTNVIDYVETWKAMEECVKLGLVKSIGLSNFNSHQIERILTIATIKPVVNQIECHVKLNQKKLREFCEKKGIRIMAYSPLGAPGYTWRTDTTDPKHIGENSIIQSIADKYKKTTAQIILRYLIEIGTIPIPKSVSTERIRQNIDIFNLKLTPEDIETIEKLDCGHRILINEPYKEHPYYPFQAEF